ncbi:MAG: Hsp20/alpha crystallin family protein [Planctomycetes bacterium]|nr:Hsp20/alpha crystallin family protein [Planctomycetota bacterium]
MHKRELSGDWARGLWPDMWRLHQEMDRLFGEMDTSGVTSAFPRINVWSGKDDMVVTAEMPGVAPSDIEISVLGDTLTLSGRRRPEDLKEGEVYHRQERRTGNFIRTIELPVRVDPEKVQAAYQSGVLRITLPRVEADKPRQVQVKAL